VAKVQKGREPAPLPPVVEPDAQLQAKLSAIEARLDNLAAAGAAMAQGAPGPGRSGHLAKKESDLRAREEELSQRAAELDRREADLKERVAHLRAEWKKRMEQLEHARHQLAGGGSRFPGLRVHVYDPDPRLQNALADAFAEHRIEAEVHGDFRSFAQAVRDGSRAGWFTVAVLGAEQDDAANVERVALIAEELPHVPRIYLSDLDLSTLRRRIFSAGANYFLEKPNGRGGSFTSHKEATEHLKTDLLRVVEGVRKQYQSFYEAFVGDGKGG